MTALPLVPFIFVLLLLLPVKVAAHRLRFLAFAVWLLGGLAMTLRGAFRLHDAKAPISWIWLVAGAALLIGAAKGRFLLSKTSARNRARLEQTKEPLRPVQVYTARSWILITVFMLLGLSLGWLGAPMLWRGAVSLAVGFALLVSSFDYLRS